MTTITHAMLLAAGLGTRMRPLTLMLPKPLVQVGGRALVDHALDRLVAAGVTTAVANVHHKAELLTAHLGLRHDVTVMISDERGALLETGGGVKKALPLLGQGPFFVHNTDSMWAEGLGISLDRMKALWNDAAMDALLLMAPTVRALGYGGRGDYAMDPDGRLTRRHERRVAPFAYTGVAILHPRLFAGSPDGAWSLNWAFDKAETAGRLYGLRLDGTWLHVGDPRALAEAEEFLRELDVTP